MGNPDQRVRESLFDFIKIHDFVITDTGYFLTYKAVHLKKNEVVIDDKGTTASVPATSDLTDFVIESFDKVTKKWNTSAKRYSVYRVINTNELRISKSKLADGWDEKIKGIQIMGNLAKLYRHCTGAIQIPVAPVENIQPVVQKDLYTDKHTSKMHIELGVPVYQSRGECDADPSKECSHGLHVGSTTYVNNFAVGNDTVLICLVNPMNVIAVPKYDRSKIRVCEYFPIGIADYTGGKINSIKK